MKTGVMNSQTTSTSTLLITKIPSGFMRKLLNILTLSLLCLTLLIGCNKEDNTDISGQIVGKWKVITVKQTQNGKTVPTTNDITGAILEFTSDLSYSVSVQNDEKETGSYKLKGDTIILMDPDGGDENPGKFEFSSDGKLHLYFQRKDDITIREIVLSKVN